MPSQPYTPLELKDRDGDIKKSWHFEFYLEGQRHRFTANINRIKTVSGRYDFAKRFIEKFNSSLKKGDHKVLNHFLKKDDITLLDAFQSAIDGHKKGKSDRTIEGYDLMLNRLRKFLTKEGSEDILASDFDELMGFDFKYYLLEDMELSPASFNWQIQHINQFSNILIEKRLLQKNPFAGIKRLPVSRSGKYVPYTDEEKKKIAKFLKAECPLLFVFSQIIYNCFMRPKEICALTRSDIDFKTLSIMVRYQSAKNTHTSHRQMFPELANLFKQYNIHKLPSNAIVFEDICGHNKMLKLRRKKVNNLWQKLVKNDLGIDKDIYAWKHTGNIDYILTHPDYDIVWLQRQNDHYSITMTERYIRDLGIYRLDASANVKLYS